MKEWISSYWYLIWMAVVIPAYAWYRHRRGKSIFAWRSHPERYSDAAVLGQVLIIAVGLVLIVSALVIVKLMAS